MYGTSIQRSLRRNDISVAEAAAAMGYKRPDMLYRILRDDADPSLDALQRLADFVNEPIGDLLPNSGANPVNDELRDILAAMSGVAGDARLDVINALAVNARVLANLYRQQSQKSQAEHASAAERRILEKLRALPPEEQDIAANIFDAGVERFAEAHQNGARHA
jgi:transcriptional regulator with XRE-family HTH domain